MDAKRSESLAPAALTTSATDERYVVLRPHAGRRGILAFGVWFMAVWIFGWAPVQLVRVLMRGEGHWTLLPAAVLVVAVVLLVGRLVQLETVLIGTQEIRRVGFLGEQAVHWSKVIGTEKVWRARAPRPPVQLTRLVTEDGSGPLLFRDTLDAPAALDALVERAARGDLTAVLSAVQREGRPVRRWRWYLPQLVVALVLGGLIGAAAYDKESRRSAHPVHRR